jgi:hypothetical protein
VTGSWRHARTRWQAWGPQEVPNLRQPKRLRAHSARSLNCGQRIRKLSGCPATQAAAAVLLGAEGAESARHITATGV